MDNNENKVITPEEVVANDSYVNLQKMFFEEFKSIVKGKVYVSIQPKVSDDIDIIHFTILNYGIKYDNDLKIYPGVADLMLQNRDYVKTMVVQEYEHYRKFVMSKFFVHEDK